MGYRQLQKKVVVIDTDLGLRNLDVVMGLENRIVYNLVDVIEGGCRLKQALIKDKRFPELYLLPSAQTKDKTAVSPEQMKKLIEELKTEFDYILLDCPAGIEQGFQNAIAGADRGIVVTTPEVSAIRDADRIIGLLEAHGIKNNDLIINRLRIDMVKRGDMMSVEDVTEILAIHLLGVIPDDEQVVIATNQGEPIVGEDCMSGKAYANICRRLLGEEIPITDFGRSEGLFSKFRDLFKKELGGADMSVPSVHIAKDRLRNLLIADRLMCTPDMSERMTSDIYYTISKYIELKPEAVQIEITHSDIHIKITGENN